MMMAPEPTRRASADDASTRSINRGGLVVSERTNLTEAVVGNARAGP
jgi:hypothetical protein